MARIPRTDPNAVTAHPDRPQPVVEPGFTSFHGYEHPLAEIPALVHINSARCVPGQRLATHAHPTLEWCFTRRGRCRWLLPDRHLEAESGDLFVALPGEPHGCLSDSVDPDHNLAIGFDRSRLLLNPRDGLAAAAHEGHAVQEEAALDHQRLLRGVHGFAPLHDKLLAELDGLASAAAPMRTLSVAMIQAVLVELFVTVARHVIAEALAQPLPATLRHAAPEEIRRVVAWLPGRLADPPDLAEMAAVAGLSPGHFTVCFKRATGDTPIEYLTRLRLDEAGRRLRAAPTTSVTEIAMGLGFTSSQYFAAQFRRHHGVTPSAWRS